MNPDEKEKGNLFFFFIPQLLFSIDLRDITKDTFLYSTDS